MSRGESGSPEELRDILGPQTLNKPVQGLSSAEKKRLRRGIVAVLAAIVIILLLTIFALFLLRRTPVSNTFLMIGGEDGHEDKLEWWWKEENRSSVVQGLPGHYRLHSASLLSDGRVLVCGGAASTTAASPLCHLLEPSLSTANPLRPTTPLPQPRAAHAAVALGNAVFLCGGLEGTIPWTSTCLRYQEDNWTTVAPMLEPRAQFGMATDGVHIYACGGAELFPVSPSKRKRFLASCERYNMSEDEWSPLAPMPGGPRSHLTLSVANGSLYAIGGTTLTGPPLERVEVLDLVTGEWTTGPSLTVPRTGHSTLTIDGGLWVFGGLRRGNPRVGKTVEILRPDAANWLPWDKSLELELVAGAAIYIS